MNRLVAKFKRQRILVVGDVMLDEHIRGSFLGGSRDSHVAVVSGATTVRSPGGAANVAANAAGLGGKVVAAGVIGDDEPGTRLCRELSLVESTAKGCSSIRPGRPPSRPPSSPPTEIPARSRKPRALAEELQERLWCFIEKILPAVDACVLSDYAKGVISGTLAARLIGRCRERGLPIVVDPKGTAYDKYRGATLIKPNHHEASLLPQPIDTNEDAVAAGRLLMERLGCAVLLTRGRRGMSLFVKGTEPLHLPRWRRSFATKRERETPLPPRLPLPWPPVLRSRRQPVWPTAPPPWSSPTLAPSPCPPMSCPAVPRGGRPRWQPLSGCPELNWLTRQTLITWIPQEQASITFLNDPCFPDALFNLLAMPCCS